MTTASTDPLSAHSDGKFCVKHFSRDAYGTLVRWAGPVCLSIFLLLIRIVWGYQFFIAGRGKLGNIQQPIDYFTQKLHIPFPTANAWLVSIVECFGGLLFLFGLGSRAVCVALVINMTVAYVTADREALVAFISGGDVAKFSAAAPFWFLIASFIVLALGPGMFSIDAVLKRFVFGRASERAPSMLR